MKIRDSVIIFIFATIVFVAGTFAFAASTKKLDIRQACDQFCANFDMKVQNCNLSNVYGFTPSSKAYVYCEKINKN